MTDEQSELEIMKAEIEIMEGDVLRFLRMRNAAIFSVQCLLLKLRRGDPESAKIDAVDWLRAGDWSLDPDHDLVGQPPVSDVRALVEARRIITDLAKHVDGVTVSGHQRDGTVRQECAVRWCSPRRSDNGPVGVDWHAESCPWRRAVEWVAEHGSNE